MTSICSGSAMSVSMATTSWPGVFGAWLHAPPPTQAKAEPSNTLLEIEAKALLGILILVARRHTARQRGRALSDDATTRISPRDWPATGAGCRVYSTSPES
jgi:hypothetical protein